MEPLLFPCYFIFILALYSITQYFIRKIKSLPPSPFPSLPIIGHLYLFKKPLHRTLSKISSKHGPVLLLHFGSRPVLLVSSPSAAEDCYAKNDVIFANRPRLLAGKYFGYNYTTLAWSSYGDHWRNLRKISSLELLSTQRLQLLSEIRAEEVRLMIRQMFEALLTGEDSYGTVDMKLGFFELTLNVMMRMIAGKRYCGEHAEKEEESRKFEAIVNEGFRLGGATNFIDYMPALRWIGYRGTEKEIKELQRKRDEFMQDLVEEHRMKIAKVNGGGGDYGGKRKKTMIEVLLKLQESDAEYYTDEMIRGLMLVLLVAGSDTSSGTMEWAMSLLLNNPQHLKKAQNEIDNHVGHERLINESDLTNLPYLHSIITETLRMYPIGPLTPHESSEECTVGGYHIPPGTMLLVNLWAIQNDPKNWEKPNEFRPERFEGLEGSRDGFKLMPFGVGRRGCPGEGLAIRMIGLALGSLIQCFEWERVGEAMVDMAEGTGLTLPKIRPLVAKYRVRPVMVNVLSRI